MSERHVYISGAWGMEVEGGQPEGQLAELDPQRKATPERIEAARSMFEEWPVSDFEPHGNRGKLRHKSSGVVYVVAEEQILEDRDPRRSGIECFIVAGDRLWFLRPRGWDGNVERGIPGEVLAGELRNSPTGGVQLVDRHGNVVRKGMRL